MRDARRRRALTQAGLGRLIGVSQGRISQLERGGNVPVEYATRLRDVLELRDPLPASAAEPNAPRFMLAPADQLLPVPLTISSWSRPKLVSGDFHVVRVVGNAVLVVAGDVAGRGAQAFPSASYAQGLIQGLTSNLGVVPELQAFAESVLQSCARVSVGLAAAFALFRQSARHHIAVDVVTFGYPAPVVLHGTGGQSALPASRIELRSPVGGEGAALRFELRGAWRILLASDGLLTRFGAGSEEDGRRELVGWQRGARRDEPLEAFLDRAAPSGDDESALLVSWRVWDDEIEASVEERAPRIEFVRRVRQRVFAVVGEERADRFANCLVDAIANACQHAREGRRVWLRYRDEPLRFTVEIEDRGAGIGRGADKKLAGIDYMKQSVDVDFRRALPFGTICTLSMEKEAK